MTYEEKKQRGNRHCQQYKPQPTGDYPLSMG